MDFCKKELHTNIMKASKYSQLTIDDDFNIPDAKEDIDKIVAGDGYIVMDEVSAEEGKVKVVGTVFFKVIYKTVGDKAGIEVYEGEIPFEDHISIDGITKQDRAESRCKLEDLTISMINSRKLEVRGLIANAISVYEEDEITFTSELIGGQGIECLYKDISLTDMVVSKNDVFKIKEEIEIQDTKPNIQEIVWSSVDLRNMEIKAIEGRLAVRGELEMFVIYKGAKEHLPIQYVYSVRSILKEIDCNGAKDGMILDTECMLGKGDVSIRQDKDGEDRILAVDYSVNMNIKLYEDKEYHMLNDIYSPSADIQPITEKVCYENLIMRNSAKSKINHRQKLGNDKEKLLQVCHVYGNVDMDDIVMNDNDVYVSGVVKVNVLYIATGDDPLSCAQFDIPFEYSVDTLKCDKYTSAKIVPSLDMLTANLINSEEIEIKAQINLGISVFEKSEAEVIVDMTVNDIDYEKKAALPGIVGYIVKPEDTLWSVARKYYATTESIKEINNLESDIIKPGDRLIIVKG